MTEEGRFEPSAFLSSHRINLSRFSGTPGYIYSASVKDGTNGDAMERLMTIFFANAIALGTETSKVNFNPDIRRIEISGIPLSSLEKLHRMAEDFGARFEEQTRSR